MSDARGRALPRAVIEVFGLPAPQGSKRAFAVRGKGGVPTGRVAVIESSHDRVKSWRQAVVDAAVKAMADSPLPFRFTSGVPVLLTVQFYLPRPQAHYGSGRNAGTLKPSAPAFPAGLPDVSKLLRSTEDALTACGAWADDAQVVTARAAKRYADARPPGALVIISEEEAS